MTGQQEVAMSVFTDSEIAYLGSQRLGRLATVGHDGMPHVVPVAFRYNPEADSIDIGGHDFAKRKKFRDVRRTGVAALVVDDVLPPWQPRAVEVRGQASTVDTGGKAHHGGLRRSDHPDLAPPDRLLGPGGRLPGAFGGVIRPPIASSVAWCSASDWSAPDGPALLTLGASSIQTGRDGSRRMAG
jgi:pyridoxamine 5'-phosphate oxidase family protein